MTRSRGISRLSVFCAACALATLLWTARLSAAWAEINGPASEPQQAESSSEFRSNTTNESAVTNRHQRSERSPEVVTWDSVMVVGTADGGPQKYQRLSAQRSSHNSTIRWPSQSSPTTGRPDLRDTQSTVSQSATSIDATIPPVALVAGKESDTRLTTLSGGRAASGAHQLGTTDWVSAAQPEFGARHHHRPPHKDPVAHRVEPSIADFGPTPVNPYMPYDAMGETWIYEGKTLNANRRPLVELGRPWYQLGQLAPGKTILGRHNLVSPQFLIYGDYRTAYASNDLGDDTTSQIAWELNLNFDFRITATERVNMFIAPLDRNNQNTRWLLDDDLIVNETNANVLFGMFEGDLGAIAGGCTGQTLPFDLPFAIGLMPLLFQNGVWMEDAVLGVAATIPARNSPLLDISNMDLTFFAAYDDVNSPAFEGDNNAANMYGIASFVDALGGYIELDYAFLEDRDRVRDRSYHNIGAAYSRRYGRFISNSIRVLVNAGQSIRGGQNTADGVLVLLENSLITSRPQTFVPYFNLFAGFDRPQSVARAAAAGGVLRNTGILFETDGLTGYPTLDDTANDTWGGALGLNILTPGFTQQLILEMAAVQVLGNDPNRNASGDQYGIGTRYQIPLSNAWIFRADAMYGFLRNESDIHGARVELRYKF